MKTIKTLANFILRFELGDIAASLTISMAVWTIFEHFDAAIFTQLTLVVLVSHSYLIKRFNHLFDSYAKQRITQCLNLTMAAVTLVVVMLGSAWGYLPLYFCCALYFQIFYTTYNAASQTLPLKNKQTVSATMEFSGKIVGFCTAGLIWLLFKPLGATTILYICVGIFLVAAWAAPSVTTPAAQQTKQWHRPQKGFAWYFCQPAAWLVTLAIMPNIIVLLSNTINSVYFYQVLRVTPESIAQLGMAFSVGSMIGAVAVFRLRSEKAVIYGSVMVCAVASATLAISPTLTVFSWAMGLFGLVNSASRVMFRLAIMNNIADTEVGSFYSLRSSLVSCIQFVALLLLNVSLTVFSPAVSVWFFPAVLLALPVLWGVSRNMAQRCYL